MRVLNASMADLPDPFLSFGEPDKAVAAPHGVFPQQSQGADWASHAITAIGLLFLASALYALTRDTNLISLGYLNVSSSSAVVTLEIIYVGLGVGVLARRELIRELCVLVAMIGVVAALYGTYNYVSQVNIDQPAALLATAKAQSHVTVLQRDITTVSAQNNAGPSVQDDTELAALDQDLTSAQSQAQTDAGRERWNFGGLFLAWVLALLPLALLTRPRVLARFT